jgi:hypothetical protein
MLKRYHVHLSLYHDTPPSETYVRTFEQENVLERLKSIDRVARRKGLAALDSKNRLVALGAEVNDDGSVTKNSYGVLNLSWQAADHPEWPQMVIAELEEIRDAIRKAHGVPLQFLIWAGMGGSAEDKSMYHAVGLLKRGPRCYVLDSTDAAKLKAILDDIQKRSGGSLTRALKSTLVAGMAMGMTSYEPVVNLEKLAYLYEKSKIDSKSNFIYMTLPGSLLDRFAAGGECTGRHSVSQCREDRAPRPAADAHQPTGGRRIAAQDRRDRVVIDRRRRREHSGGVVSQPPQCRIEPPFPDRACQRRQSRRQR